LVGLVQRADLICEGIEWQTRGLFVVILMRAISARVLVEWQKTERYGCLRWLP
jgi:hypothetical protein